YSSLILRRLPSPTLFPYTTLFRSFGRRRQLFAEFVLRAGDNVLGPDPHRVPPTRLRFMAHDVHMRPPGRPRCGDIGKTVLTDQRSEEHTSELQSRFDLVCRLLLEK